MKMNKRMKKAFSMLQYVPVTGHAAEDDSHDHSAEAVQATAPVETTEDLSLRTSLQTGSVTERNVRGAIPS